MHGVQRCVRGWLHTSGGCLKVLGLTGSGRTRGSSFRVREASSAARFDCSACEPGPKTPSTSAHLLRTNRAVSLLAGCCHCGVAQHRCQLLADSGTCRVRARPRLVSTAAVVSCRMSRQNRSGLAACTQRGEEGGQPAAIARGSGGSSCASRGSSHAPCPCSPARRTARQGCPAAGGPAFP